MPQVSCSWPLSWIVDERGGGTGHVALRGPLRAESEAAEVARLGADHRVVGVTSFLSFPAWADDAHPDGYDEPCVAWCHAFREPDRFLPAGRPRVLLTESDFTDPRIVDPALLLPGPGGPARPYDFVYVCQAGAAKERVKNWDLALRCLPVLCRQLGLHGLLVGRRRVPEVEESGLAGHLAMAPELPWRDLMAAFGRSRFLLVPNEIDPAPRIITEALAMNTPVLVNRHILGGWHHVTPFSGAFFEDEHDVAVGALRCLTRWTSPRRWFAAHHGPLNAGARLAGFLDDVDSDVDGAARAGRRSLARFAQHRRTGDRTRAGNPAATGRSGHGPTQAAGR